MAILAIVDDLLFRSKLEAAAAHTGVVLHTTAHASVGQIQTPEAQWQLVIVDLNLTSSDPVHAIRTIRAHAPTLPIIGYGSHVQSKLQAEAVAAGCTRVLPRSAFVQQLPQLLRMAPR